jgi:hypothetical protein
MYTLSLSPFRFPQCLCGSERYDMRFTRVFTGFSRCAEMEKSNRPAASTWRNAVTPYAEQAAKIFWQGRLKKSKFREKLAERLPAPRHSKFPRQRKRAGLKLLDAAQLFFLITFLHCLRKACAEKL